MDRIASFSVNHLKLKTGLYVSRHDTYNGVCVTTLDMRITEPNVEPVMDMPAVHTIEHLGATWLRNSYKKDEVLYFGPMGCRTGFYILLFGKKTSHECKDLVLEMCDFILSFEGDIPGATPVECGNYSEQSLPMAKYYIRQFKERYEKYGRETYPV